MRRAFPRKHIPSNHPLISSIAWFCSSNVYLESSHFFIGSLTRSLSLPHQNMCPVKAGIWWWMFVSLQFLERCVWFQGIAQKINKRLCFCLGELEKTSWGEKYLRKGRGTERKAQGGWSNTVGSWGAPPALTRTSLVHFRDSQGGRPRHINGNHLLRRSWPCRVTAQKRIKPIKEEREKNFFKAWKWQPLPLM